MKFAIWILGVGAVAIAVIFIIAVGLGFVQIPGLNTNGTNDLSPDDEDAPPGAIYCDFTDMQILDMLETVVGKDLNNSIGISYIRMLNMQACGSNDEYASAITAHYRTLYSDWYISDDTVASGSGWTAYRLVWLNSADPSTATLAKAIFVGEGITVEQAYGYDAVTVVSDGPVLTYGAFMIWVANS